MKKKLILAFVLALAVCLLLMPSAFAEEVVIDEGTKSTATNGSGTVAEAEETINGTEKTVTVTANTVQDLINQVDQVDDGTEKGADFSKINGATTATPVTDENGNTNVITLTQNVTESIVVGNGQTITLDLGGFTLTNSDENDYTITICNGGTLTLIDSSENKSGRLFCTEDVYGGILNCGILKAIGITFSSEYTGSLNVDNKGENATAFLTDCVFDARVHAVDDDSSGGNNVTLTNCTFAANSSNLRQIEVAGASVTIVSGDYSNAYESIVAANSKGYTGSKVTIEDGLFSSISIANDVILNITGGIFENYPTVTTTLVANGKYAVGNTSAKELAAAVLAAGETLTITSAAENFAIADAPDGATVENSSGVTITVNGVQVAPGASYTVPVPAVLAPVVEAAAPVVQAVVEKVNELVATAANDNSSYSIASNESFTIQLSYTDASSNVALPEIVSVSVNGVELEFTIAADGSIVLSPEVLAALGPGTHVITIKTATGTVTLTIVITE